MLDTLERFDDHPSQDHECPLDERAAWLAKIYEWRTLYDGPPNVFQLAYEGQLYDVALYSMPRGELELEIHTYGQDENGDIVAQPSPIGLWGHTSITLRGHTAPLEDAKGLARAQLAAWVEHMKPIRIKQDGDIITREDIRAEMSRLLSHPVYQGQTWADYAERGGITDEEIAEVIKHKFGSSGSGGPHSISVWREGSGFRLWMSWTKYRGEKPPVLKGQATLDLAREILRMEHGLLNPAAPQMALF